MYVIFLLQLALDLQNNLTEVTVKITVNLCRLRHNERKTKILRGNWWHLQNDCVIPRLPDSEGKQCGLN